MIGPEPVPPAQLADVGRVRGAAARAPPARWRPRYGQIDPFGQRQPVDPLQYQRQAEPQLELDDDRRLVAAPGDEVATFDLALDLVASPFEERLYRNIECGFARPRACRDCGAGSGLLDHVRTTKYLGDDCKAELGG